MSRAEDQGRQFSQSPRNESSTSFENVAAATASTATTATLPNRNVRKWFSAYKSTAAYKSGKKYDSDKADGNKCPFGCCKKNSIGDFLLQRGFLDGFCSDITVKAFGKEYRLHKLVLSRSGYFRTLFEGAWSDCDSSYHELIFDDIDHVTAESFELAIASLYGGTNKSAEKRLSLNMISTGQFLDIPEIVCVATDNIINDMNFETISKYTNFAYYQKLGTPSERILESARALLCIDGWENGTISWDGIPSEIITDVVGGDSFFVSTEWDRCLFIIKLIERRVKIDMWKQQGLAESFKKLRLSTANASKYFDSLSNQYTGGTTNNNNNNKQPQIRTAKSMYMNLNNNGNCSNSYGHGKTRSSSFTFARPTSPSPGSGILDDYNNGGGSGANMSNVNSSYGSSLSTETDIDPEFRAVSSTVSEEEREEGGEEEAGEEEEYEQDCDSYGYSMYGDEETEQELVSRLKECLNTRVYFCHLSFEQLQLLETLKDVNGQSFIDSHVLRDALWAQSSLHRMIVSCKKTDTKLDIVKLNEEQPHDNLNTWYKVPVKDETIYGTPKFLEKMIAENQSIIKDDVPPEEPNTSNSNNYSKEEEGDLDYPEEDPADCTKDSDNVHKSESNDFYPGGKQNANAFLKNFLNKHNQRKNTTRKLYKWSRFPPFRFSIAFCDISNLDTEKRVYGKVLWYAGCYWNLYVQKIQKHKRFQLGVYLHRASNSGPPKNGYINPDIYQKLDIVKGMPLELSNIDHGSGNTIGGAGGIANDGSNIIAITEQDIVPNSTLDSINANNVDDIEDALNLGIPFTEPNFPQEGFDTTQSSRSETEDAIAGNTRSTDSTSNSAATPATNANINTNNTAPTDSIDSSLMSYNRQKDKSLLSYEDKRQQISVYFIIRTPSRKTKSNLTCFTSSPSLFSTSQSWGWKSNSMCSFNEDGTLVPGQNKYLKFMVVLGNI